MGQPADAFLRCPACGHAGLDVAEGGLACPACGAAYPAEDGIPALLAPESAVKAAEFDRMDFWDQGWKKRCEALEALDRDAILKVRADYLTEMTREGYPSVRAVNEKTAAGKTLVNIGCGGGYEGLLFAGYGCDYIGVDFSRNAVRLTRNLTRTAGFEISAYQAEAERLPLKDASVDIVYTNGVLHHTPNTLDAVREVRRVLKPGGEAFIGLYATNSLMFVWYRLHAVARGNLTRKSIQDWLNANTEGEWQTDERENKLTETYTRDEFATLLRDAGFTRFAFTQTPLQVRHVPVLGRVLAALGLKRLTECRVGPFGGILMARCTKD